MKLYFLTVIVSLKFKNINTEFNKVVKNMLAHWIGEVVGLMHKNGISSKQLASHMGMTPEYISMVINGHREPVGMEDRMRKAIDEIAKAKEQIA